MENLRALCIVLVIATGAGFAVTTVLDVSDTLSGDIFTILTRDGPARESGDLVIVHGPPTGVDRGIQLGLVGLLFGGPSARSWRSTHVSCDLCDPRPLLKASRWKQKPWPTPSVSQSTQSR